MGEKELGALPGLGPASARWLLDIGIETPEQLGREDPLEVYLRLRVSRPGVNLNALRVLLALDLGCDWRDVPAAVLTEAKALAIRRESSAGRS